MKSLAEIMAPANNQTIDEQQSPMPPAMLVLKRVGMRQMPSGTTVAEYYSDAMGEYFLIPNSYAGLGRRL